MLCVWGDRCVNVQVLDITGRAFTKMSVMLLQDGDQPPQTPDGKDAGGYVQWMPYQIGQAKASQTPAPSEAAS